MFVAIVSPVLLCHGASVSVVIDPARLNMCPQCFEAALTRRTGAIIAAHFGRQPADIDALRDIVDRDYLGLIEDAAHSYGASWKGTPWAISGDVITLSFQMFKLITLSEGGFILQTWKSSRIKPTRVAIRKPAKDRGSKSIPCWAAIIV